MCIRDRPRARRGCRPDALSRPKNWRNRTHRTWNGSWSLRPQTVGGEEDCMVAPRNAVTVDRCAADASAEPRERGRFAPFDGESRAIERVYELLRRVARTDATVLI